MVSAVERDDDKFIDQCFQWAAGRHPAQCERDVIGDVDDAHRAGDRMVMTDDAAPIEAARDAGRPSGIATERPGMIG
jgi:hypothetical protein